MTNWFKRSITAVVLIAMVLSMAACATTIAPNPTTAPTTAAASASAPAATVEATSTPAPAKDPVTLTVFGCETEKTYPMGVQTDAVAKEIQNKLGITIDLVDESITPDKAKIMVASGDIPDMVDVLREHINTLITNNQLLAMDDLLATNGPDIMKNAPLAVAYCKKYVSNGTGKLYCLSSQIDPNGPIGNAIAPYIRWDYYAELGYPAVNSYDDLLNVVKQMSDKHPTNEDGKKMFGFSMWFDWDTFAFGLLTGYQNGIQQENTGWGFDQINKTFIDWVDNDNSFMWQGVRFWNKAQRMGLLDPDALTQGYNQALAKAGANQVICSIAKWPQGTVNKDLEKAGFVGKGVEPLPPFAGTDAYMGGNKNLVGNADRDWAISAKCKTPDRAMDLLNYFYSIDGCLTVYNGVKDDMWTVDSTGKYALTQKFNDARNNDPNYVLTTGANKYNTWGGLAPTYLLPSNQTVNFMKDNAILVSTYTQVDKDYCAHYGIQVVEDIVPKFAKRPVTDENISLFLTKNPPDDINAAKEKCQAYINKELPKMVLAKTDDELNAMIATFRADLKTMGIDAVLQWYKDDFAKASATETEFRASIK